MSTICYYDLKYVRNSKTKYVSLPCLFVHTCINIYLFLLARINAFVIQTCVLVCGSGYLVIIIYFYLKAIFFVLMVFIMDHCKEHIKYC